MLTYAAAMQKPAAVFTRAPGTAGRNLKILSIRFLKIYILQIKGAEHERNR